MTTAKERKKIWFDDVVNQKYLLRVIRTNQFHEQGGRCCYCESPMWLMEPDTPRHISVRPFKKLYGLEHKRANLFICTTEHLTAKKDGGQNHLDNVSAACGHCNSKRFSVDTTITPEEYKKYVMNQMKWDTWFKFPVRDTFEYALAPMTYIQKQRGKCTRFLARMRLRWNKFLRTHDFKFPQQMTILQQLQCMVRTIDARYISW